VNKKIYIPTIIAVITLSVLLYHSTKKGNSLSPDNDQKLNVSTSIPSNNSLKALNTFFDKLDYHESTWKKEHKVIPRISFEGVGENWSANSSRLPVATKKSIFFRLMTPLVLISNEGILSERSIVKMATLDSQDLIDIAIKYNIVKESKNALTQTQRLNLLERVDIIPPSLAVVQAAEESGWGTSRFARKGNAFFGQWDFSGNGMKPQEQRKDLGNYGVARFDSPLASVEAYMFNINTNDAYERLRVLRAELRGTKKLIKGIELTETLDKYSERGEAYTEGLRKMIRFNKLETLDGLKLSQKILITLNIDL
jgi:Bax protein